MTGRMENEEKINKAICESLEAMPVYVNEWYRYLKASNRTAATCRDLLYKLRRFLSFINSDVGNVRIWEITSEEVEKYFMIIQTKAVKRGDETRFEYTSAAYKQGIWSCLNNFFGFLKRKKYIEENYMEYIQRPRNSDRSRINSERVLLTKEDFNNILHNVIDKSGTGKSLSYKNRNSRRDLAIILLFMTTGMRKTALAGINTSDINLRKRTITIIDKGDVTHIYTLGDKVFNAITEWLKERDKMLEAKHLKTDALFITGSGNRMQGNAIYAMIDRCCSSALGYHISPHKLRAGFCSIMFEETGNIEFVRRAVGHADVSTTQRYIVTRNDERERAAHIMNDILEI